MHLGIYLWLSCVALAGYVRATEVLNTTNSTGFHVKRNNDYEGVTAVSVTEKSAALPADGLPLDPNRDLFIDDDGSGVEIDESSGSGWGPGPGPDDEDGRGSGDAPNVPEDDEDFIQPHFTNTVTSAPEPEPEPELDYDDDLVIPDNPVPDSKLPILPVETQFDVVSPRIAKPIEEAPGNSGTEEQPSRPDQTDISLSGEDLNPSVDQDQAGSNVNSESRPADNVVYIMNAKSDDRVNSFFAQPGILAAVIGGAVVGLLCAILVVMFIVYRMRKKDEGSYALDEPKRSPAAASYGKGHNNREFYA